MIDKGVARQQQHFSIHGIHQNGDIIIGGLFPIHFTVTLPELAYKTKPEMLQCEGFNFRTFRWLQMMIFTIEQINKDQTLLPNIRLGYSIYDNCRKVPQAVRAAVTLLNGIDNMSKNYKCTGSSPIAAIVGDARSTQSIITGRIAGQFRIPMVSYSSSCSCLSNKLEFPTFFRTIPSDSFQAKAMAQLVKHFGWTWVGSIATQDDYGQYLVQLFNEQIQNYGVCLAFTEVIPKIPSRRKILQIVDTIKRSTAKVIALFAGVGDIIYLANEVVRQNITSMQWIASETWSTAALLATKTNFRSFGGTIGFAFRKAEIPQFKEFLLKVRPSLTPCTGQEDIEEIDSVYSDVSQLRVSYNVYKAVYAIAHALHNLETCEPDKGPFLNKTCANISHFEPWQLLHYLKEVNFTNDFGEKVHFDENGDPIASYDIMNWQMDADGSVKIVTVGLFDASATSGQELLIDEDSIIFCDGSTKIPRSICSENCPPGTRKAARKGQPMCCFDCLQCAEGEISNQTDSVHCFTCPIDYWPNQEHDQCVLKEIEFLSFEDILGIILTTIALFGTGITIVMLVIFIHYRNTPVVRANNVELSFLLLISLVLCFLCSLTFIGQPTTWSCILRHTVFGISFALCVSCILGKTIVVLMAFSATLPNNNMMKYFGPLQQRASVFACTFLQIIICILWLAISPPVPVKNTKYQSAKIILECDVGSATAFWCMLGYIGLLAGTSIILAFLARKLPDNFNEAKFITFSMLTFSAVWVTFIPAYISSPGKYTVAVEIFAILSSSFGLAACNFVPKCYIILIKPDQNTKKHLMGRAVAAST
ncbi:extracellular calcium-sensing receptor-like [Chiloscyllium plagiosum]|uniref:extracellular calcium-sensing receptor-like n=1 Tax=Chiloscyllium plagiosum TaxID=36176 RepID=UPI001CB83997|nr:extracellular calcium-sensing receptor-like [Chiloscyllium plagiosum]